MMKLSTVGAFPLFVFVECLLVTVTNFLAVLLLKQTGTLDRKECVLAIMVTIEVHNIVTKSNFSNQLKFEL